MLLVLRTSLHARPTVGARSNFARAGIFAIYFITYSLISINTSGAAQLLIDAVGNLGQTGNIYGHSNSLSWQYNSLWLVLTEGANFKNTRAQKLYSFAFTSEGREEIIRGMNGNNSHHKRFPEFLKNFNSWAVANGFPPMTPKELQYGRVYPKN